MPETRNILEDKIHRLRAIAASTPYPIEAANASQLADELERDIKAGKFRSDAASQPLVLTEGQERVVAAVGRLVKRRGPAACFVVGFAGTGKSTVLRVLAERYGTPVVIAPTGKAALRVTEATGLEAQTIHRWLYQPIVNPRTGATSFRRRAPHEVSVSDARLVFLDEASMVGAEIWTDVWSICTTLNLRLVVVGDGFQLPPVQPRNEAPFSLLVPEFGAPINAERIEMTEVLRQAQDSPIIRASMALRAGERIDALRELPRVPPTRLVEVALETLKAGGVVICHRNATRHRLNFGVRTALGINGDDLQIGEPLVVLKNNYVFGLFNGEALTFPGWRVPPNGYETAYDAWKSTSEDLRFGAVSIGAQARPATLALEEVHGRSKSAFPAIAAAGARWAKVNDAWTDEASAPHIHANLGYAYTAHKAQGSGWPYVLVILESSIRLATDEGRRWTYTAITRAEKMTAVYFGDLS